MTVSNVTQPRDRNPYWRERERSPERKAYHRARRRRQRARRLIAKAAAGRGPTRVFVMGWCAHGPCGAPFVDQRRATPTAYCCERHKENATQTRRRRQRQAKLNAVKLAIGCQECGARPEPHLLHFHHEDPRSKVFAIGDGFTGHSWYHVQREIEKCIVLCRDCHHEAHRTSSALRVPLG